MAAVPIDPAYNPPASASTSIAETAGCCIQSFQRCIQEAASVHPREASLVEDQIARFSIWTANIRVFAPGRASLDHRLREALEVQDTVIGLLEALNMCIQECSSLLSSLKTQNLETQDPTPASIDRSFEGSLTRVANQIGLLHRFSNTIRGASKESQNLKALQSFHIRDSEGNDVEAFLTVLFANYIRDRYPDINENIRQRLAGTMLLRRKRILYRRSRYGNLAIPTTSGIVQPQITLPTLRIRAGGPEQPQENSKHGPVIAAPKSAVKSLAQTATTLALEHFQRASAPSAVSVSKTVALGDHEQLVFPPAPLNIIRKKFHELKRKREEFHKTQVGSNLISDAAIKRAEVELQELLKDDWNECVKTAGEVICPFCFYTLPAQHIVDENKWKLHVKNDIDPYVCLFEDCDSPEELYTHSSAWMKHMREHATRWRCSSKAHGDLSFESRDAYLVHIKAKHRGKFSDAQLRVLADKNGRVTGPLFRSCPLCGQDDIEGSMEDHIVGHLRSLALKSLPTYPDEASETSTYGDDGSVASQPRERSTILDDLEGHSYVATDDSQHEDTNAFEGLRDAISNADVQLEWGFVFNTQNDPELQPPAESKTGTEPDHNASHNQSTKSEALDLKPAEDVVSRLGGVSIKSDSIRDGSSDELDDPDEPDEPDDIANEIIRVSGEIPQIEWKEVDMENLVLVAALKGPWGAFRESIFIEVTVHVPPGYPQTDAPVFKIRKSPLIPQSTRDYLHENMEVHAATCLKDRKNCLAEIFAFLLDDADSIGSKKLAGPGSARLKQKATEDEHARTRIEQDSGGKLEEITWESPFAPVPEPELEKKDAGDKKDKDMTTKRQVIRIDPDCAICHSPASLACDCEAKGLEVAIRQAEARIMTPIYNDIQSWVQAHAKDFVLKDFSEYTERLKSDTSKEDDNLERPKSDTSKEDDNLMADQKTRQQVNQGWTTAYQSYPETLDYFYSLAEISLPADDDPAVRDPPLSVLEVDRRATRSKQSSTSTDQPDLTHEDKIADLPTTTESQTKASDSSSSSQPPKTVSPARPARRRRDSYVEPWGPGGPAPPIQQRPVPTPAPVPPSPSRTRHLDGYIKTTRQNAPVTSHHHAPTYSNVPRSSGVPPMQKPSVSIPDPSKDYYEYEDGNYHSYPLPDRPRR